MLRSRGHCLPLIFFTLFFAASSGDESTQASINSLDALIRDHAFMELRGRITGVLYHVPLPANLSGISASAVRLRSGSLWSRGTNSSLIFDVPPGIMIVPYALRLIIVYQDFGSHSSSYFNITGYSLVSPVVGLSAYDASNTSRRLDFHITGDPIQITFPRVSGKRVNSTGKCAMLRKDGSTYIGNVARANVCRTKKPGRFAIVVPNKLLTEPLPDERKEGHRIRWKVLGVAAVAGLVGMMLVVVAAAGICRVMRKKKVKEMESKAEDGEPLENIWVGSSKMPSATMMRTQPAIENTEIPP